MSNELRVPALHSDYLITVGYDDRRYGYYVIVADRQRQEWNDTIYKLMDTKAYSVHNVIQLEAALVVAIRDHSMQSKGPMAFEDVCTVLALIADPTDDQMSEIINMKETYQ
jgi:hypothetical protein